MIQIYHNNRCSKSRECVAHFENSDSDFEIINYLQSPPSVGELKSLLKKLNLKPIELVRTNEKIWKEQFAKQELSDDDIIFAISNNPILIQRPIVVNGNNAVIARPVETINQIL